MARKLDPKAIKQRIKENTAVMRETKTGVTKFMNEALKQNTTVENGRDARNALSAFIKASVAVKEDKEKLNSLIEQ